GALSRYQNPRQATHSPPRGSLAWRYSRRRLDRQGHPPIRPHQLRSLRTILWPEPIALRSAQAQRSRTASAGRIPLPLPPHLKGYSSRVAISVLPQTAVRPPCQQPLPPPTRPSTSPNQPTRSRLSPRRQGHPEYRRVARRSLTQRLHCRRRLHCCGGDFIVGVL